ncbi:G-protein coupled receptor 4-like [Fundulus heteroclitus]|uniref:G-protein coupled receptor 4-like n=1 Tax=Fundulus heteroclitus TaxID=8078 RepID=UPI00165AAED5|nr:G-protein coupled receptor 4-like [Fundulus heteroclitus]
MISWLDWITTAIGLPFTLIVIVAVFLQVKKNQCCPIFVINLLFSDVIQFCGRITLNKGYFIGYVIFNFGLFASVGFMVCISLERYLVIAKPLWYRFRRNIKTSVVVCVVVWVLSVLFYLIVFLPFDRMIVFTILSYAFLLPIPVFIFCFVRTIKALSGALSFPADKKRRIAAIQVAVLLTYTLLFMPIIIVRLNKYSSISIYIFNICLFLSPLADTTLYLLSRKSFLDKFLASLCSCETSDSQEMSTRDIESTTVANTETV